MITSEAVGMATIQDGNMSLQSMKYKRSTNVIKEQRPKWIEVMI